MQSSCANPKDICCFSNWKEFRYYKVGNTWYILSSRHFSIRIMVFNLFWRLVMVINSLNGNVINSNQVYIHDDILEELSFNRLEKKIHLSLLTEDRSERFSIDFLNVIGFEMTSCDF